MLNIFPVPLPIIKIRYTSPRSFILVMKGDNTTSILDEMISGGGITIVEFSRIGEFRMIFQSFISGSSAMSSLIVLEVAVAVMKRNLPEMEDNSPLASPMAGLNAAFSLVFMPQLTTEY